MQCSEGSTNTAKPETSTSSTVIDTKPPATTPPVAIKPTKTQTHPKTVEKKATQEKDKESTKNSPAEIKVNTKSNVVFSSIVEVKGGPAQKPPQISSKAGS